MPLSVGNTKAILKYAMPFVGSRPIIAADSRIQVPADNRAINGYLGPDVNLLIISGPTNRPDHSKPTSQFVSMLAISHLQQNAM